MKKIVSVLMALAFVFSGVCFAQSAFNPLQISLWAEESGYEWTCEYSDNGVLSEPICEYIADENGLGGEYDFHFGVLSSGKAGLVFNYGITWGIAAPTRTMVCSVLVDEAGNVQIRSAECFNDDGIITVRLPGNPSDGMNWNFEAPQESMITLLGEDYSPYADDLETAGGITEYEFSVSQSGSVMLMFNYTDMWNPYAAAEETFVLLVSADSDMHISLNLEESADER